MSSPLPSTAAAGNTSDTTTRPDRRSNRVELDTEDDYDEDEEDMDFMPARERRGEDDDEDSYESASEGLSGIDIEFEVLEEGEQILDEDDVDDHEDSEIDEGEGDGAETETEFGAIIDRGGGGRPVFVSRQQIAQLLGTNGLRRLLARGAGGIAPFLAGVEDSDEDEEEDDDFDPRMGRRTRSSRRPRQQVEFEKVPSEEGRKLMLSGTFGGNERGEDSFKRRRKLASRLVRREMGLGSCGRQKARNGLLRQVRLALN